MKTVCLVADVTAVGSHDRAERAILGVFVPGLVFLGGPHEASWKLLGMS